MKRFPILRDARRTVFKASSIIEYLGMHHPGPKQLIPADAKAALEVRMMDRFFDNYISTPQQKIMFDSMRDAADRDRKGVAEAFDARYRLCVARHDNGRARMGSRRCLQSGRLRGRAVSVLCRLDPCHRRRLHPSQCYRNRLLARPSFARAVDEARPYRYYFPLGAPDRD